MIIIIIIIIIIIMSVDKSSRLGGCYCRAIRHAPWERGWLPGIQQFLLPNGLSEKNKLLYDSPEKMYCPPGGSEFAPATNGIITTSRKAFLVSPHACDGRASTLNTNK